MYSIFDWYDLIKMINIKHRGKGHNKQPHNKSKMKAIKNKQKARSLKHRK